MKTTQDNDVTSVIYAKNDIELSGSTEQGDVYDEKQTKQR